MSVTHPTLVFDGDCGICRTWVDYWRLLTGDRVVYRPYQEAARDFPAISPQAFADAIQFIEPDGQVFGGAAATYRMLTYAPGHGGWWWLYTHLPGFKPAGEWAYGVLSRHRGFLAYATRLLWGRVLEPEQTEVVCWVYLRLFGLIYAAAFASLGVQILGLVGHDGLLPLEAYLGAAREIAGSEAYRRIPTLFWFDASDTMLVAGSLAGVALGLLVFLGLWTRAALIALFVLYLSYVYAGQVFMSFQWDALLLEAGFLAIFLTSGSSIVVWLYRWLVARYLFLAGVVKLTSGDPTWRGLTALDYHFWTQPLPAPLAWYAAQLPRSLLAWCTAATLAIELAAISLVVLPRRLRFAGAWCVLAFQLLIILTGNYNFFNLLTVLMCLFLFDDAALRRLVSKGFVKFAREHAPHAGRVANAIAAALAIVIVPVGLDRIWTAFERTHLPVIGALTEAVSPLLIVNPYGLFATMTITRPEIVIEGSDDGRIWREYVFRYKPGPVDRPLFWNIPHQPRLDWQMWFAAYEGVVQDRWFEQLMRRILEGSPKVLALLETNPFPDHPPKYLRAELFDYRFTDFASAAQTGAWWTRQPTGLYFPKVSLRQSAP